MLDKFKETELKIYMHTNELSSYQRLRKYESSISSVDDCINLIRKKLATELISGKCSLCAMPSVRTHIPTSGVESMHPSEEMLHEAGEANAVLIDDQFLNKYENISINDTTIPVHTILDFIETLHTCGCITKIQKYSYISKLRGAGFSFIPITSEELDYHLKQSTGTGEKFRPSKELKLLKENLSLLKISRLIQLPRDTQWLEITIRNITTALKKQWDDDTSIDLAREKSNWLYELADVRTWSHFFEVRAENGIAYFGKSISINSLLLAPNHLSAAMSMQYHMWLDSEVLVPLKNRDPSTFNMLVDIVKSHIETNPEITKLIDETNNNE